MRIFEYTFIRFNEILYKVQKQGIKFIASYNSSIKPQEIPKTKPQMKLNIGHQNKNCIYKEDSVDKRAKIFYSFKKARAFARSLNFQRVRDWEHYCRSGKKPIYVPTSPCTVYKGCGWISMCGCLGVASSRAKVFKTFNQARTLARSLGLSSCNSMVGLL